MEETVIVDGQQYKLTYDNPLTAQQKAQAIADIRKQSCKTCGPRTTPRSMAGMGNDWQYGGRTRSLVGPITCPTTPYSEDEVVTLTANPDTGTAPYTVRFWRRSTTSYSQVGTTQTVVVDGGTASASITITDADIAGADGNPDATEPDDVDTTDGTVIDGTVTAAIDAGKIRLVVTTIDSCPTGNLTCLEWCDIILACAPPSCNFIVS